MPFDPGIYRMMNDAISQPNIAYDIIRKHRKEKRLPPLNEKKKNKPFIPSISEGFGDRRK